MPELTLEEIEKLRVMRVRMNNAAMAVLRDMAKRVDKAKHPHAMFALSERLVAGIVITMEQITNMNIEETLQFLFDAVREQLEELDAAEVAKKRRMH